VTFSLVACLPRGGVLFSRMSSTWRPLLSHVFHVAFSLITCLPHGVCFCMAILRFRPVDPRIYGIMFLAYEFSEFHFRPIDFRNSEIPNTSDGFRIRSASFRIRSAIRQLRSATFRLRSAIFRIRSATFRLRSRLPYTYPQKYIPKFHNRVAARTTHYKAPRRTLMKKDFQGWLIYCCV
jgi:hypothetical protein